MALENEQELRRLMREEFRMARQEEYAEQGLDFNKHSEHHTFICALRKRLQTATKAGVWTTVSIGVGGLLTLIWKTISNGGM